MPLSVLFCCCFVSLLLASLASVSPMTSRANTTDVSENTTSSEMDNSLWESSVKQTGISSEPQGVSEEIMCKDDYYFYYYYEYYDYYDESLDGIDMSTDGTVSTENIARQSPAPSVEASATKPSVTASTVPSSVPLQTTVTSAARTSARSTPSTLAKQQTTQPQYIHDPRLWENDTVVYESEVLRGMSYTAILICPVGILGNLMQIVVMQATRSGEPVSVVFRVMAAADLGVLVAELLRAVLDVRFPSIYLFPPPPALCHLVFCFFTLSKFLSSLTLVVMCVDRLGAVVRPLQRLRHVTCRRMWLVEGVVLVVSLVLTALHYTLLFHLSPTVCNRHILMYCWTAGGFAHEGMVIYLTTVSNYLLSTFLPALVLLVVNAVIVIRLRRYLRETTELQNNAQRASRGTTPGAGPLVVVSALGCFTLLPKGFLYFVYATWQVPDMTDAVEMVFRTVDLIYLLHFSEPFFILFLSSSRYRTAVRETWRRICCGQKTSNNPNNPTPRSSAVVHARRACIGSSSSLSPRSSTTSINMENQC